MIDYAVLANWVATDESDEARRLREIMAGLADWIGLVSPPRFFDDWAIYHDHRRRYAMRRKIRKIRR